MQVEGLNVKLKLTAHGPSLIVLKLTAPPGAIFVSPPGGNIDILLQFYNFVTFDPAWFSASSKEREELKVRLVSGVERQTNTFEVKMMLTVLLMMIMMERQ